MVRKHNEKPDNNFANDGRVSRSTIFRSEPDLPAVMSSIEESPIRSCL